MGDKPIASIRCKATIQDLARAIICGNNKEAVELAQNLLQGGLEVETLVEDGLTKALESLDVKCNNEQFSLLEILLAGRAMMDVMEQVVCEYYVANFYANKNPTVIVLGTIKGDVHDLGKNIVALMLKVGGYKVVDLGKDVEPVQFIEAADQEKAQYIGVSSLLATSVPYVCQIRELVRARRMAGVYVIAGGAALQQAHHDDLNVDFVAHNVFDLLRFLRLKGRG